MSRWFYLSRYPCFNTEMQGRSQTSYTSPCNGVVSHGSQIGGLRVFADHARKNKSKAKASTIFSRSVALYSCFIFTLRPQKMQATYAPDEPRLFWLREKPEHPNLSPMQR